MGIVLRYSPLHQQEKHKQKGNMKSYLATALTVLFTLEMGSCGHYYSRSRPSKSVFSSLVSDSRFSTLVAAVTAAGLTEEAINDLGPLTIFAPTNEAFAKIPSDALAGQLEDVPALTEILLRHVVPKKIVRCSRGGMSYDNAGGSKITVDGRSVSTSAASAKVIAKVRATDGIVYAIDTVV